MIAGIVATACGARLPADVRTQAKNNALGVGARSASNLGSGVITGTGSSGTGSTGTSTGTGSTGTGSTGTSTGTGSTGTGSTGTSTGTGSTGSGGSTGTGTGSSGTGGTGSAASSCGTLSGNGVAGSTVKIGTIADVTGPVSGLFQGAEEGSQAFAQFVNNTNNGICGHQVQVAFKDGGTNCTQNENGTASLVNQVFAFVGTFSLYDNCGANVLKQHSSVPDIHVALDPAAEPLPNHFDLEPGPLGYATGMFAYYKQKYGSKVQHVGTISEAVPSAEAKQAAITHAATVAGWKFVASINEQPTNGNFVGDFVKMCTQQHIQVFFTTTENAQNAATMIQNEKQAGCPSSLINVIPIAYDPAFLSALGGGASLANGLQGYNEYSLFFNPDEAKQIPELGNMQTWFSRIYPGQPLNLYAMFAWADGRLFQQAVEHAGKTVNQKSVITALRKIKDFSNNGMISPTTPSSKSSGNHCYILWQLQNGKFSRQADPPVTKSNPGGYRCDGKWVKK
jgi:hypothetical protein